MPGRLEAFFWEARSDSGTSQRGHKGKWSHPNARPPLFSSWPGAATSYTAADVQAALLKQIRASKKKTILVKRPQQEHVKFMDFGEPVGWAQRGPPGAEPSLAAGSVGRRMGAPLLLAHTATSRASKQPPLTLLPPTPTSFPPSPERFAKPQPLPALCCLPDWIPRLFTTTVTTTTATTMAPATTRRYTTASAATTAQGLRQDAAVRASTKLPGPLSTRRPSSTLPAAPRRKPPGTKKPPRPCDSHPCLHGGTCEDDGQDFTCSCPAGKGGAVCEKRR